MAEADTDETAEVAKGLAEETVELEVEGWR